MDNEYRCEELVPFFEAEAKRELQDMTFYLSRLEKFIVVERDREINELKQDEAKQSPKKDGFWEWNYPVHWDEIFVVHLRSSFITSLVSFVEANIGIMIDHIGGIACSSLKCRDLSGNFIKRNRTFLEKVCGFSRPSDDAWAALDEIRTVRNCIIHAGARIYMTSNENKMAGIIRKLPGLSEKYGVLDFAPEFPEHALKVVTRFMKEFYEEAKMLCESKRIRK